VEILCQVQSTNNASIGSIETFNLSLIPDHSNTDVTLLRGPFQSPLEEPGEPHGIRPSSNPEWQGIRDSAPQFFEHVPLLDHIRRGMHSRTPPHLESLITTAIPVHPNRLYIHLLSPTETSPN